MELPNEALSLLGGRCSPASYCARAPYWALLSGMIRRTLHIPFPFSCFTKGPNRCWCDLFVSWQPFGYETHSNGVNRMCNVTDTLILGNMAASKLRTPTKLGTLKRPICVNCRLQSDYRPPTLSEVQTFSTITAVPEAILVSSTTSSKLLKASPEAVRIFLRPSSTRPRSLLASWSGYM